MGVLYEDEISPPCHCLLVGVHGGDHAVRHHVGGWCFYKSKPCVYLVRSKQSRIFNLVAL